MRRAVISLSILVLVAAQLLVETSTSMAAIGDITEYAIPTATSYPLAMTAGPDGNLWFTEFLGKKVAKVTTSGVFTEYAVPTANSGPQGITAGPDGNVWFAEAGASKVAKVTTSGLFSEYTIPTTRSNPYGIAAGPDGNLWFTEVYGNKVAKVTTSGAFTEYTVPTANSYPKGIVAGPDGNLWFIEFTANKVARVTTSGVFTEYPIPTANSGSTDIAAGPDGNLWFTEPAANMIARVTTLGAVSEFSVPTAGSSPIGIVGGPDGSLWFTENHSNKVASLTTSGVFSEYGVPTVSSSPAAIAAGADGNMWFLEVSANQLAKIVAGPTCVASGGPSTRTASSTRQYSLANNDGVTWQEIDASKLHLACVPSADEPTVLTANADLWTGNAGVNQDLGIFVSINGASDELVAWKESGGFAGTFSPNAAYLQQVFNMAAGNSYLFKLKWKTNKPAPGATIFAGAGSGPYSPTSLTAEALPSSPPTNFVVTSSQYTLANSDGVTWQPIDAANLSTTLTPSVDSTAVLGANADLWTANAGFNQDLGIFVSDNAGADQLVAWKESGGFAGTFSPNAAFVKAIYPMAGGHSYLFTLKWKTNKSAPGSTIFAAAGSGPFFSPTSLLAETLASSAFTAVSTGQYKLPDSDGSTWQTIDPALDVSLNLGPVTTNTLVGANADLWTANAGYNQDLGIFVSDMGGPDVLLAWKESGGFAGTFSPNAAFVQTTYQLLGMHGYVFKLKWKTNKSAPGATIYAAAGGAPVFSPTRLTIELTN